MYVYYLRLVLEVKLSCYNVTEITRITLLVVFATCCENT